MGYSIEAITDNCYEGTACLINKLNIRDEQQLSLIEADITFAKISELEQFPLHGNFDFVHYKAIHRYIFSDLYDWAGQVRTVNISKKGTAFVNAENIESVAEKCFARLKNKSLFNNYDRDSFIEELVDFYCTTNLIHPFREGNGRTQRVFITQLIRNAGFDINFSQIDTDELMIATIQAANGVRDNLIRVFGESIIEL